MKRELKTTSHTVPMTGHFLMPSLGVKDGNLRTVIRLISIQLE